MSMHYDALETRTPAEREAALLAALPAQVAHAQKASAAFASILAGVDAAAITSRAALAQLPVTRKYELLERQQAGRAANVVGGFSALGFGPAGLARMEVVDAVGQRTVISFSGWKKNPSFSNGTFRFTPPKDVDVIGER